MRNGTSVSSVDKTLHETETWMDALCRDLGTDDPRRAWGALRAVLHALRDGLSDHEAARVGERLPLLVRGLFYEGWEPGRTLSDGATGRAFLARVEHTLPGDDGDPEEASRAVFGLLARQLGEEDGLPDALPQDLRSLWTR